MKKVVKWIIGFALLATFLEAGMFQSVTPEKAQLLQSGKGKLYCPNCGMNLVKFYKTSHAMKQKDGAVHQYCSIHCLVEELMIKKLPLQNIQVVDVQTLKFMDVEKVGDVLGRIVANPFPDIDFAGACLWPGD